MATKLKYSHEEREAMEDRARRRQGVVFDAVDVGLWLERKRHALAPSKGRRIGRWGPEDDYRPAATLARLARRLRRSGGC